jgi:hypothetical protein
MFHPAAELSLVQVSLSLQLHHQGAIDRQSRAVA